MYFHSLLTLAPLAALAGLASAGIMPSKIFGVNLGSWLLIEPWMLPIEWKAMGGEMCDNCLNCVMSESSYVQAHPETADAAFAKHWDTWFTENDVDQIVAAGINTVRIPVGWWIIEALVDRNTEFFPKGGLSALRRGLQQLRDAGIAVVIDHHALPGAQTADQMFTGICTNTPEFYTDKNYHRALVWTAVMAGLTHIDPAFRSVFSIQAVNEPAQDATKTPGLGDFQKNFVKTVRAVELGLGLSIPGFTLGLTDDGPKNVTHGLARAIGADIFTPEVHAALKDAIPILATIAPRFKINGNFSDVIEKNMIVTNHESILWQYNNPSNPAESAIGPQTYDMHLYYFFGGVADPNENAYLIDICTKHRTLESAAQGNAPVWWGEWSAGTQFNATEEFNAKWVDAQKLMYTKDGSLGWFYWSWKTEENYDDGTPLARQWSYQGGLERGYLTRDPSQFNDPHVCDPYTSVNATSPS